ncbi:hypothetical protein JXA88_15770, partial [Candidatus Fermentibacteria bacterium]|nr:hypothetical protein [Candidatus Fermentibacteria bacterium]
ATTGYTCAVQGLAFSSAGRAVSGECNGTAGIGVVGWAGATTGGANGVFGYAASPAGAGVVGQAAATTGGAHGVYGTSAASEGRGVTGIATAATGMNYGVYGQNDSAAGSGVYGSGYHGVWGDGQYGVYGDGYYGVTGHTTSTYGYGVYYSGGLAGTGTKSCVVKTSKGPTLMYCQESPENWFEDFGEGQLVSGRAHIELDPVFLETVTIDAANPMKVFVQLGDDSRGVFVRKGTTGFDVVETQGGASSIPFDYRVIAKRQGFEAKRLDVCEAARTDSYLYPELREREQAEREASKVRHEEERARREQERVRMEQERARMEAAHTRRDPTGPAQAAVSD